MLVCCWFDLGLKLLKVENGTFENRTIAGNSHYLVPFGNRTIAGTALIETALTGDPLYLHKDRISEKKSLKTKKCTSKRDNTYTSRGVTMAGIQ